MSNDIVMISADDLFNVNKFRDKFGVEISTPNMDRVAAMGVTFNNAYTTTALCNPSRTAIMTGQSPFTTGVHENIQPFEDHIDPANTLIGILKSSGYETAGFGKILHEIPDGVAASLFDTYFRIGDGEAGGRDGDTTAAAIDFLESHPSSAQPLLLMMGFRDPHTPFTSPQEFLDLYPIEEIAVPDWTGDDPPAFVQAVLGITAGTPPADLASIVQHYLANISEMDARLGELLDAIESSGRAPTIVFYSDHGLSTGDHDHVGKFDLWEQSANPPLIIARPGGPAGATSDAIVSLLDIAPTILGLAGIDVPAAMEGQSLLPLLGEPGAYAEGPVMTTMSGSASIRDGDWRISRYEDGSIELFNVASDPDCADNLHGTAGNAAIEASLLSTLDDMLGELGVTFSPGLTVHHDASGNSEYFVLDTASLASVSDAGGHDLILSRDLTSKLPEWAEDLIALDVSRATGNAKANFINSGEGNDVVRGLAGADTIYADENDDRVHGGDGNDSIRAATGSDLAWGNAGRDSLFGDSGADDLHGGTGNDSLFGNSGNDLLNGGKGSDFLAGGGDSDDFVFTAGIAGIDTVSDYVSGKDRIVLSGVAAGDVTIADHGADAWITYGAATIKVIGGAGLTVVDLVFE